MSAYRNLHEALTSSLIRINENQLGNLPIAYEGLNFDPETIEGDIFIDESYIYGEQESLTKDTLDEITGIYQLSVYQRAGKAVGAVLGIVDILVNNYVHNSRYVANGQKAVIINSSRGAARFDSGWYIVDVSVSFKSDKLR